MNSLRMGVALLVLSACGAARADGNCQMGARVTDRQDQTGTVVKVEGNRCYVKLDKGDKPVYYSQWQLRPAGVSREQQAGGKTPLAKGHYSCVAAGAGTMKLDITSDSRYAGNGKPGNYVFDNVTQKIRFTSGPWEGMYGARLAPGKIGVSSRPGNSYMTTCNLK